MNRQERGAAYLAIVADLSKIRTRLDGLVIGDPSGIANQLKHTLDAPIEQIRGYARALLLGGDTPAADQGREPAGQEAQELAPAIRAAIEAAEECPVCGGLPGDGWAQCPECGRAFRPRDDDQYPYQPAYPDPDEE